MNTAAKWIIIIYALLVVTGGITGFALAKSTPSLLMGSLFGTLLIVSVFLKRAWGLNLALVLSFLLDAFFSYRYLQTGAFFPAGIMSLLSLFVVVYLAWKKR